MPRAEREAIDKIRDFFTLNLDESCSMENAGISSIVGNGEKSKHKKNIDDNRDSITTVRVGSAGNVDGPCVFLAKGKTCELGIFKNFGVNFKAPPGSCVEMTPLAYTTQ